MVRVIGKVLVGVMLLGTASASLAAEEHEGRIQRRKENQQKRIAQGVKNGSLTPGETAYIEKQESNLNKEIRADRKANGGNLTNNEKKQINQQQNQLSREIYREKHDGETQSK